MVMVQGLYNVYYTFYKFVLTGGTDNDGTYGNPLTKVTSYNIEVNVVLDLPELQVARMQHGCTYFSNNDNEQV